MHNIMFQDHQYYLKLDFGNRGEENSWNGE